MSENSNQRLSLQKAHPFQKAPLVYVLGATTFMFFKGIYKGAKRCHKRLVLKQFDRLG